MNKYKSISGGSVRSLYLLGNPNVGKSTVFNAMTGLRQHTGNWSGKTVDAAYGSFTYKGTRYKLTDLPGTHSVSSDAAEERAAGDALMSGDSVDGSVTLILADATRMKRGIALALEFLENSRGGAVLCVNLCDIAEKRGIKIDCEELSLMLGIPVIGITAKRKSEISRLKELIHTRYEELCRGSAGQRQAPQSPRERLRLAEKIAECCVTQSDAETVNWGERFDRIVTSRLAGIPIMLIFFGAILWLTICGANYPSELLSHLFANIKPHITALLRSAGLPQPLIGILCDGVYDTVTWIVAVMLPPMAIFFPLFTLLEDLGFLPRIAFNLDSCYARSNMNGKQCLTQCMGLGCNAVGVSGCRIMPNESQRSVAIITNCFMPCNGRFALLISMSAIFIGGIAPKGLSGLIPMLCVLLLICVAAIMTWLVSFVLTKTLFKSEGDVFALELPEYRRPEILRTLTVSLVNRTLRIVGRALLVSAPTGAVIWLLANTNIGGSPLLTLISGFFDPFGKFLGVDGFIVLAFILSLPANEITLPILVMSYLASGTMTDIGSNEVLRSVLTENGWTIVTAVNMMLLTLFHWPCATTLMTIYHETKSKKILALSVLVPCAVGIILCLCVKYGFALVNLIF